MQLQPPMTPRQRFFIAVTVLSFLTVTGVVIGCDSDDGPTVTAPNGGNGGTTPTRNMTAEQQGREGLEETDGGRAISNTGEVALNVRFNYNGAASGSGSGAGIRSTHTTARHYRLDRGATMPSDPANTGTAPTRFACGVPATARANGQCFDNDRVTTPESYSAPLYGSIAWGYPENGSTWTVKYGRTEAEARNRSMDDCREFGSLLLTNCQSFEFSRGQCAALARDSSGRPISGVASSNIAAGQNYGSAKLAAENAAIAQCRSRGGEGCSIAIAGTSSICLSSGGLTLAKTP